MFFYTITPNFEVDTIQLFSLKLQLDIKLMLNYIIQTTNYDNISL